jgi:hypothetical protein
MYKPAIMIICVLSLIGRSSRHSDSYTVNCSIKTATPSSNNFNQADYSLIKKRIAYVCSDHVGLVELNKTEINKLK